MAEISKEPSLDQRGFVFATTGQKYTMLARRAARNLRGVMPEAQIDLFTDQTVEDTVFDQVHAAREGYFRPKTEAIQRSRFDRTLVLDADCCVVAPLEDVFDVLDKADIAGVCAGSRPPRVANPAPHVPRAFPVINSGVLAVRGSDKVRAFAAKWEAAIIAEKVDRDQGILRRLLWDEDVTFVPLGTEYNLKQTGLLWEWLKPWGAPRILHQDRLHMRAPGDPEQPFQLSEVLQPPLERHVRALLGSDWSAGGDETRPAPPPGPGARSKRDMSLLQDVPNRALAKEFLRRIRQRVWPTGSGR